MGTTNTITSAALLALSLLPSSSTGSLQAPPAGVVHLPVTRNVNAPRPGAGAGGPQHAVRVPRQRRASGGKPVSVDLKNLETIYSIDISIAGQPTSVILDTGSFELWVDPDCSTASRADPDTNTVDSEAGSPAYCESVGRYDPSSSSTAEALGEGAAFGYADHTTIEVNYYTDTIDLGGLEITAQQFGVANVSNATSLGIMGMGPSSVDGYNLSQHAYSLILDSMAAQGKIASRAFSLDLRDYDNATGSIIFGGLDKKKFAGSLQTLPLESVPMKGVSQTGEEVAFTDYGYYVTVQSVGVTKPGETSSSKYDQASFLAVLDSGTSIILTPEGMSAQICADLGGDESDGGGGGGAYCVVDCGVRDRPGGLDFAFAGGKTVRVSYRNLLSESVQGGGTFCFLQASDTTVATDPPTYILGDPFLRAAYAVFDWDNQQVHLAEAADCGSEVVAIGTGADAVPTGGGCKESSSSPASVGRSIGAVLSAVVLALAFLA